VGFCEVGRYEEGSDFSGKRVEKSVLESMERLGVDYIDVMQCHDMEFAQNLDVVINEAIPVLQEYKRKGLIGHIGVTGLPLAVIDYVLEQTNYEVDTVLSYCNYTLNNVNLSQFLPGWKARDLGIIQGGAMSMGLLTPQGPQDWHPAPDLIKKICRDTVKLAEYLGGDILKLAFQYTHSNQDAATCLVGITSVEQLENTLRWANEPIDQYLLDEIEESLAIIKNKIWVEKGSEENIALSVSGFFAHSRPDNKYISGESANLGKKNPAAN